jgi:transposase InsO family protein
MSGSSEKSIKIIPFSGKQDDYYMWASKFQARAMFKGYLGLLTGTDVAPADDATIDETTDAGKKLMKLRKANMEGFSELILSCESPVAHRLVKMSVSEELPNGDLSLAWKRLEGKYQPKTKTSLVKLKKQYEMARLDNVSEDPEEWITELEDIQAKIAEINPTAAESDENLMIHILANLPTEYDTTVEHLERQIDQGLTLEGLRTELRNKYSKIIARAADESRDEKLLLTGNGHGKFKGKCNNCGKTGHKAANCWHRDGNSRPSTGNSEKSGKSTKRFTGKCHFCGKTGHRVADCWKKQQQDQQQKNTSNNETANVAEEGELVMTAFERAAIIHDNEPERKLFWADWNEEDSDDDSLTMVFDPCEEQMDDNIDEECFVAAEEIEPDVNLLIKSKKTNDVITRDTFIGDTGATSHMTGDDSQMYNVKEIKQEISFGDKRTITAVKRGDIRVRALKSDGTMSPPITLSDVLYAPGLKYNLYSLTKVVGMNFTLRGVKSCLIVENGNFKLIFNKTLHHGSGILFAVDLVRCKAEDVSAIAMQKGNKIDYTKLHEQLGHQSEDIVRATAKELDWLVKGKVITCVSCAKGKARQKNIPKSNENHSEVPGERIYTDISSVRTVSKGGRRYWALFVDDASDMPWSAFLHFKSDFPEQGLKLMKHLKEIGKPVRYIRCDNAGENKKFKELCEKEGLGIKFEFTAPGTPQQNAKVERMFATLYGRTRAMLIAPGLTQQQKDELWAECAMTATKLQSVTVRKGGHIPYRQIYGTLPRWIRHLRIFGEVGIVTDHANRKIKGKLRDRGFSAMMLGYSDDHEGNVYRLLKLKTGRVIHSRDVTWLNKTLGQYQANKMDIQEIDEDEENSEDEEENTMPNQTATVNREVQNLTEPTEIYETIEPRWDGYNLRSHAANLLIEKALTTLTGGGDDPANFQEAWHHPDPVDREKWREAIRKEFRDMIRRGVWRYRKRNQLPGDRKVIGSKWVFKKKRNGVYRARLVALGYSQIPGVDYTENFAPVVNDITFRILLVAMLMYDWNAEIIDVETAFLEGKLDTEIFMNLPEGIDLVYNDIELDTVCELTRSIYGLVQAARLFWQLLTGIMIQDLGFCKSRIDPCLLVNHINGKIVVACCYVDDICLMGEQEAIDYVKTELGKHLTVKLVGKLKEYIGVNVEVDKENGVVKLTQPDIMEKLEKYFGEQVMNMKEYETPMQSSYSITRPKEGDKLLSKMDQSKYRSGVGSLLYLVKHSRPDLSNAVRELSKVMDKATNAHMQNLLRAIKYTLDTRNQPLILKPHKIDLDEDQDLIWNIKGSSDSDFAGDRDTRVSVTGYRITVNGATVGWKSRGQRSVTLSSTEAEYVACSETCAEIMHIKQILEFLGWKIKYPIIVKVDNMGAIYLANNAVVGNRTKHVDVRYHFIREFVEDGIVKIVFVRSEENTADPMTKNVATHLFKKHTRVYWDPSVDEEVNCQSKGRVLESKLEQGLDSQLSPK